MMPELGQYAGAVLSAYVISILVLVVIVGASVLRARKVKADLERIERDG